MRGLGVEVSSSHHGLLRLPFACLIVDAAQGSSSFFNYDRDLSKPLGREW